MTVEDFKKLIELERKGYWIYCAGDRVQGLSYDEDMDPEEFVLPKDCKDAREMCCNFVFEDDRYTTVQSFVEFNKSEWTVMKPVWINDWQNYEG